MSSTPSPGRVIGIPDEHRDALNRLAQMTDEQVSAIAGLLRGSERTVSRRRVARSIADKSGLTVADASELIAMLGSLLISKVTLGIADVESLANEVARGATVAKVEGTSERPRAEALRRHLQELLSLQPILEPLAKAEDLLYSYPSLLQESRVITDVRPIFTEDATPTAVASIITHTLQLETTQGGTTRQQTLFISMDVRDLRRLKAAIDRALVKDEVLRTALSDSALSALALD